ncbi:ABC transporter substrate-binding protein [Paracoccus litorisediminis]|uniref:PhnD/SsuA/transferrin family substrate-binding protein n=1 Tax=Paracoccus litorisediminis TaxID=2006130 RepID=A0A844HPP7_9RHOB|nr:ABC transporter substrate-binding protein [Paracoccus litorisediminis]MTH60327.1 PhnD/SsuA/transferrin family substrate-binding protein [Paracoccus litorisediminis]
MTIRSTRLHKGAILAAALASLVHAMPAQAEDIPTIRVGWTMPGEDSKYWMMKRPEKFEALGKTYNVEWVQFQGTAPMVQAMIAGALDCSTQGALSLANGHLQGGLNSYVVASHLGTAPDSFSPYWAVAEDSEVKTGADLKGKTVGINVLGSGLYGQLYLYLKAAGLDPQKDIKLVETGFPGSEDALRAARVDAAVMNQPFAAKAEAKGGIRKLFTINDVTPNSLQIFEVCRKDFVDENPELAANYVRDLTRGMDMALADRAESIKVASEVTKAPAEVLDGFYMKDGQDFERAPGAAVDFKVLQAMLDLYHDAGMIPAKLDAESFHHAQIAAPLN